jgi:hypothetical protein
MQSQPTNQRTKLAPFGKRPFLPSLSPMSQEPMDSPEKAIHSKFNEKTDSDEKSTSTTRTPILEIIPDPPNTEELSPVLTPTRSRRPTLAAIHSNYVLETMSHEPSESVIEPARGEKWTVKRVGKVTWAYVTTWKVIPPQEIIITDAFSCVGIFDYCVYA